MSNIDLTFETSISSTQLVDDIVSASRYDLDIAFDIIADIEAAIGNEDFLKRLCNHFNKTLKEEYGEQ